MAIYSSDLLVNQLEKYLNDLKQNAKENPEKAREDAKNSLSSSGVLDENGKVKDQIVEWGY